MNGGNAESVVFLLNIFSEFISAGRTEQEKRCQEGTMIEWTSNGRGGGSRKASDQEDLERKMIHAF